jgi:hypothetical protein
VGCGHGWPPGIKTPELYLEAWLNDEVDGSTKSGGIVTTIRTYIKTEFGDQCSICHVTEWMGQSVPLVLDHIDGNSTNNTQYNLRLVCGNCDMQLPTYKSKNKGSGRYSRRQRYAEGKSY